MSKIPKDVFQYVIKPFLIPNEETIKAKRIKFINKLFDCGVFMENETMSITISHYEYSLFDDIHLRYFYKYAPAMDHFLSIQIDKKNPSSYRKAFNFLKYFKTYVYNPNLKYDLKSLDYYTELLLLCAINYFKNYKKKKVCLLTFCDRKVDSNCIFVDCKGRVTLFIE